MSSLGPGTWVGGGIAFVTIPALAGLPGQTVSPTPPASQAQLTSTEWLGLSPFSSPWQPGTLLSSA